MALQFSVLFDRLISLGIDQHSRVDAIPEGYVEDAIDVDTDNKALVKRQGFEKFAGDVPLRVEQITILENGSEDTLELTFPSYVDLTSVTTGPIWLQGKWEDNSGSIHTFDNYFSTYTKVDRFVLDAGSSYIEVDTDDTGVTNLTSLFWVQDADNLEVFFPEELKIDPTTYDIRIDYDVEENVTCYIYSYDIPSGEYYTNTYAPSTSISIPASTHALPTQNIIPMIYEQMSASREDYIIPDEFEIDSLGDVTISFPSSSLPSNNLRVLMASAPSSNVILGTASGLSQTTTIQISEAEDKHIFAAVYQENPTTSKLNLIIPTSITYNSATETHEITIDNGFEEFAYRVFYLYGENITNKIRVETELNLVTSDYTTSICNLAVSGIDQSNLPVKTFINYLDSYRSEDEMVITADGQMYRSVDPSLSVSYDGRKKVYPTVTIAPTFTRDATPGAAERRTQGYIYVPSATAAGYVEVTSVAYEPISGYTRYTLNVPSYEAYDEDAVATSISNVINFDRDTLTIIGLNNARFNGEFEIKALTEVDSDTLYVDVENASIDKNIWDSPDVSAYAGIFTDQIPFLDFLLAEAGDEIVISDELSVIVTKLKTGNIVYVSSVEETSRITAGRRLGITASKTIIPTPSDSEIIPTDIVEAAEETTRIEESTLVAFPDLTTSGNTTINATSYTSYNNITVSAGDTLTVESILIVYGEITVESGGTLSVTTGDIQLLSANSILTFREAASIVSGQIDITVPYRWQLVLPADDTLGLDTSARTDVLKSVEARGNLYLADGTKYDGDKTYRTGIPRIQTNMFISLNEDSTAKLVPATKQVAGSSAGNIFTCTTTGEAATFPISSEVMLRENVSTTATIDSLQIYTVTAFDESSGTITLDRDLGTASNLELSSFETYSYFLRLAITDRNGNFFVGPSTGSIDLETRITKATGVILKGWVLPEGVENLDYAHLNLEIFRRKNTSTAYYKLAQIPLSEYDGAQYITFTDSAQEAQFSTEDLDKIVEPGGFGGIGINRGEPLIAEHVTTINNQLVYGNLRTRPRIDLTLDGTVSESDFEETVWELSYSSTDSYKYKVATSSDRQVVGGITTSASTSFSITGITTTGMTAGDWVYIAHDASNLLQHSVRFCGWYQIESVDSGTQITILDPKAPSSASSAESNDLSIFHIDSDHIPLANEVICYGLGQTTSRSEADGIKIKAMFPYHLACAITVTAGRQRIYARGGREMGSGRMTIEGDYLRSLTVPSTLPAGLIVYANGDRITDAEVIDSEISLYDSRLILSYPGYPEVFSQVFAQVSSEDPASTRQNLPLVQDINPDDGEELQMSIPFFAQSAFGAAQQTNLLVAMKAHSIYVVDPQAKLLGSGEFYKQLETRGLGCEAPSSVINSADGVLFVNSAGIFLLDRTLQAQYLGSMVERLWEKTLLDKTRLSNICSSNYVIGKKFRISIPTQSSTNHTSGELSFKLPENPQQGEIGAWTRYSGFNAVLWASKGQETYFATDRGYVGRLRNDNTSSDYQDAGADINMEVLFRAQAFGLDTVRKLIKFFTLFMSSDQDRNEADIQLSVSNDLSNYFSEADNYTLRATTNEALTGIGDIERDKLERVSFSPKDPRMTWIQVKLTETNGFKKNLNIHQLYYKLARLRTARGQKSAAQTNDK